MNKGERKESTLKIIELSKRPEGLNIDDLPEGVNPRSLWKAAFAGHVFTLKSGTRLFKRQYFDTQERADAYYEANPRPTKKPREKKPLVLKAAIPGSLASKPLPGGPARLPGEPVITKHTKITIAPPPPAVLYHSNTHNRAG